ncbi:MAG: MotE family protein [Desulfonauticus sp.]|nr:MotE family protein [Desulfonauticus sp.]
MSSVKKNKKNLTKWPLCVLDALARIKWKTLFNLIFLLGFLKIVVTIFFVFAPDLEPLFVQKNIQKTIQSSPQKAFAKEPKITKPQKVTQKTPTKTPKQLSEEWARLKAKEKELAEKEASLKELEAHLEAKLKELKTIQAQIKKMLDEANVLKNKRVQHLVKVYSNMKPKQAAQVIESLDEKLAVKILAGMRGRQAGAILSYVSPKKAAKLSEELTKLQVPFSQ